MRGDQLSGFSRVAPRPITERLRTVGETVPVCNEAADTIDSL